MHGFSRTCNLGADDISLEDTYSHKNFQRERPELLSCWIRNDGRPKSLQSIRDQKDATASSRRSPELDTSIPMTPATGDSATKSEDRVVSGFGFASTDHYANSSFQQPKMAAEVGEGDDPLLILKKFSTEESIGVLPPSDSLLQESGQESREGENISPGPLRPQSQLQNVAGVGLHSAPQEEVTGSLLKAIISPVGMTAKEQFVAKERERFLKPLQKPISRELIHIVWKHPGSSPIVPHICSDEYNH